MTIYKHIVQVHPVENGEPNLYKVKREIEFTSNKEALEWLEKFNYMVDGDGTIAVYRGRVNDTTGELE